MKRRPRRKAGTDKDDEDSASTCSTPLKDKENLSPSNSRGRPSFDTHKQKFITLLKDFDQNVAMTKKDIVTQNQMISDNLTLPFLTALMKLPSQVKSMKWGDYLKTLKNRHDSTSTILSDTGKPIQETNSNGSTFALPSGSIKMETPALRSSSRLAKNKLPVITPKFDPSTPAAINKRLPKPGEVLVSLRGSPVAVPNPTPFSVRGVSSLATADEKDVLVALLNNPETLNNALKDKDAFKALQKAYNSTKLRKE